VTSRGEILGIEHNDRGLHSGELWWQDIIIDLAVLVFPGDVVEVDGVQRVLLPRIECAGTHGGVDFLRVQHLLECGACNEGLCSCLDHDAQ